MGYKADVLSRNPRAYYRCGEAAGIPALEEVGGWNGAYVSGDPGWPIYQISPPASIDDGNKAIDLIGSYVSFYGAAPLPWGEPTVLMELWAKSSTAPGIVNLLMWMGGAFGVCNIGISAGILTVKWGIETFTVPFLHSVADWNKYSILLENSVLKIWRDTTLVFSNPVAWGLFTALPLAFCWIVGSRVDEIVFYTDLEPSGWIFEDGEWKRPPVNYLISANPSSGPAPLKTRFSLGVI